MVHPSQLDQKNDDLLTPLDFLCFKLQHYPCQIMPYVQLKKAEKPIVHTEDNKKDPLYQLIWTAIKEQTVTVNTEAANLSSTVIVVQKKRTLTARFRTDHSSETEDEMTLLHLSPPVSKSFCQH